MNLDIRGMSHKDYEKIFKDIDTHYRNNPNLIKEKIDIKTWRSFAWSCIRNVIDSGIRFNEIDVEKILKGNFDEDKIIKDREKRIKKASKSFQKDFVELAEEFFTTQPFYYDSAKIWWLWDFKLSCWIMIDETDLLNEIYDECKENGLRATSSSIKSEITTAMKMVGRKHKPLESPNNIIQFKDKIYWIDKDKVRDASPEYFNCNPIPFDVGESEDTPTIDKIFEEWVGKKYVKTLYEIIAYCMVQDYPLNRIFCFVGSGSNGKSCFLNLLRKIVGENNCSSTELDRLIKTFGTSCLYKKLVCLMGETNFGLLENTSIIKRVSGNDPIDFEFKGKDLFVGKSYAKLIIATNTIPPSTDKTDGFYRRWVLIDFPNKFNEKCDILNTIPDIEYNNLCKKSIRIVKELLKKRKFSNEGDITDRKRRYEALSNPLIPFIKENCIVNINEEVPIFEFYDGYCVYLKQRGMREPSKQEVTKLMLQEGFEKGSKNILVDADYKKYWCYLGLRFKDLSKLNDFSTNSTNSTLPLTSIPYRESSKNHCTIDTNCTKIKEERVLSDEEALDEIDKLTEESK